MAQKKLGTLTVHNDIMKWTASLPKECNRLKPLLNALVPFTDANGYCFVSRERLVQQTGMHPATISTHLTLATEAGLIRVFRLDHRKKGNTLIGEIWIMWPDSPLHQQPELLGTRWEKHAGAYARPTTRKGPSCAGQSGTPHPSCGGQPGQVVQDDTEQPYQNSQYQENVDPLDVDKPQPVCLSPGEEDQEEPGEEGKKENHHPGGKKSAAPNSWMREEIEQYRLWLSTLPENQRSYVLRSGRLASAFGQYVEHLDIESLALLGGDDSLNWQAHLLVGRYWHAMFNPRSSSSSTQGSPRARVAFWFELGRLYFPDRPSYRKKGLGNEDIRALMELFNSWGKHAPAIILWTFTCWFHGLDKWVADQIGSCHDGKRVPTPMALWQAREPLLAEWRKFTGFAKSWSAAA